MAGTSRSASGLIVGSPLILMLCTCTADDKGGGFGGGGTVDTDHEYSGITGGPSTSERLADAVVGGSPGDCYGSASVTFSDTQTLHEVSVVGLIERDERGDIISTSAVPDHGEPFEPTVTVTRGTTACVDDMSVYDLGLSGKYSWRATHGICSGGCPVEKCNRETETDEACYAEGCSGAYTVSIREGSATHPCELFNTMALLFEVEGESDTGDSGEATDLHLPVQPSPEGYLAADSLARCEPGQGLFTLIPDGASRRRVATDSKTILLPVQLAGNGTMTSSARLTSIVPVYPPTGGYLGIITSPAGTSAARVFDIKPLDWSLDLNTTRNRGYPGFVVQADAPPMQGAYELYLSWTCEDSPASTVPPGFVLLLDDIGCPIVQKLVLRPQSQLREVTVELYGVPQSAVTVYTQEKGSERQFAASLRGLHVKGTIAASDGDVATIRLDRVRIGQEDICHTGTYTLASQRSSSPSGSWPAVLNPTQPGKVQQTPSP